MWDVSLLFRSWIVFHCRSKHGTDPPTSCFLVRNRSPSSIIPNFHKVPVHSGYAFNALAFPQHTTSLWVTLQRHRVPFFHLFSSEWGFLLSLALSSEQFSYFSGFSATLALSSSLATLFLRFRFRLLSSLFKYRVTTSGVMFSAGLTV